MDVLVELIDHPIFENIVTHVLGLKDSSATKQLLLIARHMGLAVGWGDFRDLTARTTRLLLDLPIPSTLANNEPLRRDTIIGDILNNFSTHPLYSGAVVYACFINPKDRDVVAKEKMDSFMKEILVMDSMSHDPRLNFSAFFGDYDTPIHSDIPRNHKMAVVVHQAIDTWLERITSRTHFPKMSKKCLPSFTRQELRQYIDILLEDPSEATPGSLERLYVKEGIFLDGPCEMSQRWYTNGLVPRTYFVAGATAYNDTKYTKWLWNELVDCLSVTNKRNRVNPRRIYVDRLKEALFYDLTSFTSNMGSQRPFLEALATYCIGQEVTVMDSYLGPRVVPLDDLIRTYNQMNCFPEYRCDEFYSAFPDSHGVAGFLGVFGNIATCTFLHGAVLLQLADREHECGCAGDDAVICVLDEGTVSACIDLLGILAIEKTYSTRDFDVVYLKRRTWIDPRDFCLRSATYVQIPSFLPWVDFNHEYRFTRESSLSRREKFNLAASSLQSTFRSVGSLYKQTEVLSEVKAFCQRYYQKCSFPEEGNVPQFSKIQNDYTSRFIPNLDVLGLRDWVELTISACYSGECWLPDRSQRLTWNISSAVDTTFRARGGEYVNFLSRLGYVEKLYKPKVHVTGEQGLIETLREFTTRDPCWMVYRIIEEIPYWLRGGFDQINGIYENSFLPGYIDNYTEVVPPHVALVRNQAHST